MSSAHEARVEPHLKDGAPLASPGRRQQHSAANNTEEWQEHMNRPPEAASFNSLGLDTNFVRALHHTFPNVKRPTAVQAKLIPEIFGGRDILLKDDTGSGKTFGLILGLLNKPRMVREDETEDGKTITQRLITTLFIVPHRDLAYQILHWIERIMSNLDPTPPLASIAQVLVRGAGKTPEQMLDEIKKSSPHILICTPQAFLEVYSTDKDALQLDTLSTVVVDEVDYLVPTAARKDPTKSFWKAYEKAVKKVELHPGPTREILDIIYARRKELSENQYDPEADDERMYNSTEEWRNDVEAEEGIPQLVLSSATLRVHLKNYLFAESRWLNTYNVAKIIAEKGMPRTMTKEDGATYKSPSAASVKKREWKIEHSILVVSDTGVRNVEGAVEVAGKSSEERESIREAEEEAEEDNEEDGVGEYYHEKYDRTESPFNPIALETIATAFALDVPSVGLLVIPSSAPVQRAVYELRSIGVNAHGLDLLQEKRGKAYLLNNRTEARANPTLLVATLATTRGLDLPGLTHVFILGVPEGPAVNGRTIDAYLHIAGRAGRFGQRGKVISVVSEVEEAKMVRVLDTIRQKPVLFEQIN